MNLTKNTLNQVLLAQKSEITEYHIYNKIAKKIKDQNNAEVLKRIGEEELAHYNRWKNYTNTDVKPNKWKIFKFYWIAKILGLTFGIKLMERGENEAQINYKDISNEIPEALEIAQDEDRHEKELIDLIDEEKLNYVGSMVLGLNDALVEMTGALAGFTFALQNNKLIAIIGLITGISATLSMAASEYLSTKAEDEEDDSALKAAIYTGIAYIITVILLILPYFLLDNPFISIGIMLAIVLLIIFIFNYYLSVAKDYNFKRRFFEMAFVSIGVAALSFGIGFLVNTYFGIEA